MKNISKIILEELQNFDFLNTNTNNNKQEINDLIMNHDFQKRFICDSILHKNEKIKILNISNQDVDIDYDIINRTKVLGINIDYRVNIGYIYDTTKEPLKLTLEFTGKDIQSESRGTDEKDTTGHFEINFDYIDWAAIDVTLFNEDGDDIEFNEVKTNKINTLFIRSYLEDFFMDTTGFDLSYLYKRNNDKTQAINYCQS